MDSPVWDVTTSATGTNIVVTFPSGVFKSEKEIHLSAQTGYDVYLNVTDMNNNALFVNVHQRMDCTSHVLSWPSMRGHCMMRRINEQYRIARFLVAINTYHPGCTVRLELRQFAEERPLQSQISALQNEVRQLQGAMRDLQSRIHDIEHAPGAGAEYLKALASFSNQVNK